MLAQASRPRVRVMPRRGTGDLDRLDPAEWDWAPPRRSQFRSWQITFYLIILLSFFEIHLRSKYLYLLILSAAQLAVVFLRILS
jgi:hypothetical protein